MEIDFEQIQNDAIWEASKGLPSGQVAKDLVKISVKAAISCLRLYHAEMAKQKESATPEEDIDNH
jgi:hypothetical protein